MKQRQLEICVYNLENLFIKEAFYHPPNINYFKSQIKLNLLRSVFNEIAADIYALTEVGEIESLQYFNEHYLDNRFNIFHTKGNSDRGIENAFLVKKDLPLKFEHLSHTQKEIDFKLHDEDDLNYFLSRDFSHLRVFHQNGEHALSLLNVHLKSQRDDSGHDFRSVRRRKAELELLINVYKTEESLYPDTPIALCGDFNGNASNEKTDDEFKIIYERTSLIDALGIFQLPLEYRTTFYQFVGQAAHRLQLDYFFVDKKFSNKVTDAAVYQYKNSIGRPLMPPRKRSEIWDRPSDHHPIYVFLDI